MPMVLQPLIAILGTTGVGKSNLGVELALRLSRGASSHGWKGAKIINADSMQVYSGLDIITNKIPEAEKRGVEHLLMDFKKPGDQYVVGDFVCDALKLIHEIHERDEIPIVVGGTSYWIQHLMFPNRLTGPNAPQSAANTLNSSDWSKEVSDSIAALPPNLLQLFGSLPEEPPSAKTNPDEAFDLHRLLCLLDPPVGNRWHWRDTRKVLRSLNIILESRRRASDIFFDQSRETGSCKPRFRTLCFWLYAEPSRLRPRLDGRVDEMIRKGLLDEIRSLRTIAEAGRKKNPSDEISHTDFTLGIYQSIGYKEFDAYLTSPTDLLFREAVDLMKLSTRQYAKKQISWMRNKLLPAVLQANAEELTTPLYLLDATDLGEDWVSNVSEPGVKIMEDFLDYRQLPEPNSLSENAAKMLRIDQKDTDPTSVLKAQSKIICPVCTLQVDRPVMIEGGDSWLAHQKTRIHRKLAAKANIP